MSSIPTINMAATGDKIKTLRSINGLSVRDLQEMFGFATPQAIYKWQNGTTLPTVDNLVMLAEIFGVSVDDILVIEKVHIRMGA